MTEEGSRTCKMSCGDVTLKITLTPKLLKKPFEEAVLAPFLKAYSKKAGLYGGRLPAPTDVSRVTVDETMLGDHRLPGSVILLANQTVEIDVTLKPPPSPAAQAGSVPGFCDSPFGYADPFAAPTAAGASARDPPGGTVEFDGKTEVERLKEQRRAARLARENAEAAAGLGTPAFAQGNGVAGGEGATLTNGSPAPPGVPAMAGAAVGGADVVFFPGTRATVVGLSSETGLALNGQAGTVLGFLPGKDRFQLRLDCSGQTINVRKANLELHSTTEAGGVGGSEAGGVGIGVVVGAAGGAAGGVDSSAAGSAGSGVPARVGAADASAACASGGTCGGSGSLAEPEAAGTESAEVLSQLASLEEQCDTVSASVAACDAALHRIDYGDVEADEAVAVCGAHASVALASVATLSVRLDEVQIGGSTSDAAREEARARRKALRNRLEAEMHPAMDRLRAALAQARRRVE